MSLEVTPFEATSFSMSEARRIFLGMDVETSSTGGRRSRSVSRTRNRSRARFRSSRSRPPQRVRFNQNQRIGGFIGLENKFHDSSLMSKALSIATTAIGGELDPATANCFNGITIGDTESTRDGRKYTITSINFKGNLRIPKATNQSQLRDQGIAFLALVWDKQTNGSQLNSENVYTNPSNNLFGNTVPFRNLGFTKRFQVLWSRRFVMPQEIATYDGSNVEMSGSIRSFQAFIKKSIPVICTGNGSTVSVIGDNSIHLVGWANGIHILLDYNMRIRFMG